MTPRHPDRPLPGIQRRPARRAALAIALFFTTAAGAACTALQSFAGEVGELPGVVASWGEEIFGPPQDEW